MQHEVKETGDAQHLQSFEREAGFFLLCDFIDSLDCLRDEGRQEEAGEEVCVRTGHVRTRGQVVE